MQPKQAKDNLLGEYIRRLYNASSRSNLLNCVGAYRGSESRGVRNLLDLANFDIYEEKLHTTIINRIHRILSTDWFRDSNGEIDKLRELINVNRLVA